MAILINILLAALPFIKKQNTQQTPQTDSDICRNPKTKPNVLLSYASSKNPDIINGLLNNVSTPELALDKIAENKQYKICLKIIKHQNVSNTTLEKLTRHWHVSVVRNAKEALTNRGILNRYSIN